MNKDKIKSTLFEALNKAGAHVRSSLLGSHAIEKKSELSLVTAIDRESEEIVLNIIREAFPDHAVLAEESLGSGDSPHRWIIDPIDGTTNFAHTYPIAVVSIAFESEGIVQAGGIYDPFRDELFFAMRGEGAFLNDKKISVSKAPSLSESLLVTGFPYDRRERIDEYLGIIKDFMMKIQGLRRTGSAATDLCYVACGRFDGYWEASLNPWDIAAGAIILEEAGGKISGFNGEPFKIDGPNLVASNGIIHQEMLEVLKPHLPL